MAFNPREFFPLEDIVALRDYAVIVPDPTGLFGRVLSAGPLVQGLSRGDIVPLDDEDWLHGPRGTVIVRDLKFAWRVSVPDPAQPIDEDMEAQV